HGIKIIKEHFNFQRQKFNVNFWDFGGQEIMHATHQFFLTKRCLYLLVLDSRKDEKAEYWLHYIQSFGRDAPVVMVLNKIDEYPSFDVNRKFLSKKYGNIQAYHKVSCRTDEGLTDLKKYLMDLLWNLELRSTTFPREWLKVKMSLETMKEDYISYAQYQALCKKNQVVKPDSQNVLLDLLNDLGVILNYERLRWYDTQVLNPLWLTNSVYRIINSPSLAKTNGSFFLDNLNTIINDERYQDNKHLESTGKLKKSGQKLSKVAQDKFLFIVAMMKQFELLFEFAEHRYLVPELLPIEENTYQFKTGSPILSLVIEYVDFLPTAIIPRLMVKMHKYIYNNQIWKTGMVLEEASIFHSIANIVLDKEEKKIYIDIQGQRGRDFLTMIRETVKEINSTYQNLEITEWVPLPSSDPTDPTLVSYKELLGYEKAGWEEYLSGELLKKFQVSELLNGIEKPEFRKQDISCRIFVSYAEKDHQHKEELIKHLMPLVRLNKATLWDKTCIDAGKEWMQEIYDNLDKADIVLCLVSSSFIASDFCYGEELGRAMAAHKAKKKVVIPIKAREANWDNLEIATLQELPRNNWLQGVDDDKSWVEIAKGIEAAIDGLKGVEGVGCK
ncbi:MAG: TIR domain-containing protein, partial [Lewinella sp.]|nr:TIR domain-containing protein [Lewinella sp.]